jgi:hypothetical protein
VAEFQAENELESESTKFQKLKRRHLRQKKALNFRWGEISHNLFGEFYQSFLPVWNWIEVAS